MEKLENHLWKILVKECLPNNNAKALAEQSRSLAIEFAEWVKTLRTSDLVTVHPPAGSGAGVGLYVLTTEQLFDKFLSQKQF